MKWLFRIVIFLLLFMLLAVGLGGNIGPYELLLMPAVIVLVMWGCSRMIRLGQKEESE